MIYVAFENDAEWPAVAPMLARMRHVVSVLDDPQVPGGAAVVSDAVEGVRQAVAHFVGRGRRRIVQVLNTRQTNLNRRRIEGLAAAWREFGFEGDPAQRTVRFDGYWDEATHPRFAKLCEDLVVAQEADAILANDDWCAAILLRALAERGLRVPDDVAVIGWGKETFSRFTMPQLTTVDLRLPEIAATTLNLLDQWIEHGEAAGPAVVTLPPQLAVRESA